MGKTLGSTPWVENTLEGKKGLSCLLHLASVWSPSVTNTPLTMHVKNPFVWSWQPHHAPPVPAQKHCGDKQPRCTDVPLRCSEADVWHLPSYTLKGAPCTSVKEQLWISHIVFFRAPERIIWAKRPPKIGCLFISHIQSFRYRSLYLKQDVATSQSF